MVVFKVLKVMIEKLPPKKDLREKLKIQATSQNSIKKGQKLKSGEKIFSANKRYAFYVGDDAAAYLMDYNYNTVIWSTPAPMSLAEYTSPYYIEINDYALWEITDSVHHKIWNSDISDTRGPWRLVVLDDGTIVIVNEEDFIVWSNVIYMRRIQNLQKIDKRLHLSSCNNIAKGQKLKAKERLRSMNKRYVFYIDDDEAEGYVIDTELYIVLWHSTPPVSLVGFRSPYYVNIIDSGWDIIDSTGLEVWRTYIPDYYGYSNLVLFDDGRLVSLSMEGDVVWENMSIETLARRKASKN